MNGVRRVILGITRMSIARRYDSLEGRGRNLHSVCGFCFFFCFLFGGFFYIDDSTRSFVYFIVPLLRSFLYFNSVFWRKCLCLVAYFCQAFGNFEADGRQACTFFFVFFYRQNFVGRFISSIVINRKHLFLSLAYSNYQVYGRSCPITRLSERRALLLHVGSLRLPAL